MTFNTDISDILDDLNQEWDRLQRVYPRLDRSDPFRDDENREFQLLLDIWNELGSVHPGAAAAWVRDDLRINESSGPSWFAGYDDLGSIPNDSWGDGDYDE